MKKLTYIAVTLFCFLMAGCSSSKTTDAPAERTDEITAATPSTENQSNQQQITRDMENLTKVLIKTSEGNITIALYDNTPKHKENFIKLVNDGFYNGVLFHRIIQGFMIQTGDWATRYEKKDKRMKEMKGNFKYRIPAEIRFPTLFHKRGAVAAAREPDSENPKWESSPTQFYIVYGWDMNEAEVELYQHKKGLIFCKLKVLSGIPFLLL